MIAKVLVHLCMYSAFSVLSALFIADRFFGRKR